MVICFSLRNKLFQSKLIERFIEYEPGNIFIEDSSKSYDILITDSAVEGNNAIVIDYELNAREIYTLCKNKYIENGKITKFDSNRVFSFSSLYGGSGVSVISLTFSRLLSLKGESVIHIICQDKNDPNMYVKDNSSFQFNIRKLEYLSNSNKEINPLDFLIYDEYRVGILVVSSIRNIEKILSKIDNKIRVVIDLGKESNLDIGKHFLILNHDDSRTIYDNSPDVILNKSSQTLGYKYNIPIDKSSFNKVNDIVEISLDGPFSKAVSKIIENEIYG